MGATIKTRIQLKSDTEVNWNKAVNFIPLKGEVIIYSADGTHPFSRLKVGDGVTNVHALPFIDSSTLNGRAIYADTIENFRATPNFIPHKGDIIIFFNKSTITDGNGNTINVPGIKIGDGLAYNLDLPYVGDDVWDELTAHIIDNVRHITAAERQFWNNKLNCNEATVNDDETLIFNRN